jgi:hypothetical protein
MAKLNLDDLTNKVAGKELVKPKKERIMQLNLKAPVSLKERIDKYAEILNIGKSELMIILINDGLEKLEQAKKD